MHSVWAGRKEWGTFILQLVWCGKWFVRLRERAEGVLIVPDWSGSGLLAVLESRVKEGKIVLMEKWRPSLICPGEIGSNTLRGMTKLK